MEFRAIRDRFVGDVREIARAALGGLGLVDRPAYPWFSGAWKCGRMRKMILTNAELEAEFDYDTPRVTASRGSSRKGSVRAGAFFVCPERW